MCMLVKIVDELYAKLLDSVKIQLIWVTKEMVNVLTIGFDELLVVLLRESLNGDFCEGNLCLGRTIAYVYARRTLYVFLHLLADHNRVPSNSMISALKRMEVEFRGSDFRWWMDLKIFCKVYGTKTPSWYSLLCIATEMETQLRFLLTHWFVKRFLRVPERETVLTDIVRFICCSVLVIHWLLMSCRKRYIEANLKLALFYDWLFFDGEFYNIC
ncbi:hypothetical protein R3W88_032777 [Solanum pinnatisectum]|uniref:Integrator complex subunit 3 N-terminal domain-containing protein n=1 Tax=Solanum pinnatisectum TaxID=50273 RepID=A0AAV9LSU9_9SOLN|nr:hypothetical protein R3W88_032777 [Solanum pinnatisectum]